jgi:hypothetical protein
MEDVKLKPVDFPEYVYRLLIVQKEVCRLYVL